MEKLISTADRHCASKDVRFAIHTHTLSSYQQSDSVRFGSGSILFWCERALQARQLVRRFALRTEPLAEMRALQLDRRVGGGGEQRKRLVETDCIHGLGVGGNDGVHGYNRNDGPMACPPLLALALRAIIRSILVGGILLC